MVTSGEGNPLPIRRTSLIGRAQELAALGHLLRTSPERLLTLAGVGGSGKTSLAVRVAGDLRDAFPDGVWFVDRATTTDAALLPQVVVAALGGSEDDVTPADKMLVAYLRPRTALLVLDNCEHLVDACALLGETLLTACPALHILATSREPLQIPGERQWRVAPLAVPDPQTFASPDALARCPSVQLFVERAQLVAPGFALTGQNAAAIAAICTTLDGLPLGLELAAARVSVLGVDQIRERLSDCLRLLTAGGRAKPARQQTLRAALTWSYDLLSEMEQATFRRLAVFTGGWSLEAAEAVCDGVGSVLDLLSRLVDKSLVLVDIVDCEARYRLLEPLRQFARQLLEAAEEAPEARARHLAYYVALAEQAAPALRGPDQVRWLDRLTRERDNLHAALQLADEHGDGEAMLRLAGGLTRFWEGRSHFNEGRRWYTAALRHPAPPAVRAKALIGAGRMAHYEANYDQAIACFRENLDLARELGNRQVMHVALTDLGMAQRLKTDLARSEAALEESLAIARALNDRHGSAVALLNLGATAPQSPDIPRSLAFLVEGLALFDAEGDVRMGAITQHEIALLHFQNGDLPRSREWFAKAQAIHARNGDRWCCIYSLMGLASAEARAGRPAPPACSERPRRSRTSPAIP